MMKRFGIAMAMGALLGSMVYREEADGAGGDLPGGGLPDTGAKPPVTKVDTGTEKPGNVPPAPAEKPGDADVLDKAGYAPAENDPGLNYAMKFLAGNGFNADNPAVSAAFEGDFSLLKAELSAKGIQGWEQALGLAEQSYDRHVKELEGVAAKVGEVVTSIAEQSGVDWEQAVAHVGKTAAPEEKTALNELLKNPATAHIAAQFITGLYANADGVEIEPQARATTDGARPNQTVAGGPLTRAEYKQELDKLRGSLGDDYINSPQAQALYKRLQR